MKRSVKGYAIAYQLQRGIRLYDSSVCVTRAHAIFMHTYHKAREHETRSTKDIWAECKHYGDHIVPVTITYDDGKPKKRKGAKRARGDR